MGKKVDLWSAGVVLLEMLYGKPPQAIQLDDSNNRYIRKWVEYSIHGKDEELKALLAPPETLTNQHTFAILEYCLEFKASERKSAAEILRLVSDPPPQSLMETVALSSSPSDPPPHLWLGSNGVTIPLDVLRNPSSWGTFLSSGS